MFIIENTSTSSNCNSNSICGAVISGCSNMVEYFLFFSLLFVFESYR